MQTLPCVVVALLPSLASAQQEAKAPTTAPLELRVAVAAGSKLFFRSTLATEVAIDAGGQQQHNSNELTFDLAHSFGAAGADGRRPVKVRILRVRGRGGAGAQAIAFDSATPQKGEPAPELDLEGALRSLCGRELSCAVDPRGELHDFGGIAEAIAAARDKAGIGGPAVENLINETTLRRLCGSAFAWLPERPVEVGAEWPRSERLDSRGTSVLVERSYRLAKVADATCELVVTGKATTPDAGAGAPLRIRKGSIQGSETVDRADGCLRHSQQTSTAELLARSPGGEVAVAQTTRSEVTRISEREATPPAADGGR